MAPGEHGGWAIVDPVTGQVTGGVIVCTPEVCGSGWFAGMRVVLQTTQDPVEASNSANGVGNVAGYSNGTYNFDTGQWTMPGADGEVLVIPLAYPGADQSGNVNNPFCILNCALPSAVESGGESDHDGPTDNSVVDVLPDLAPGVDGVRVTLSPGETKKRIELNEDVVSGFAAGELQDATNAAKGLQTLFNEAVVNGLTPKQQKIVIAALQTPKIDDPLERRVVQASISAATSDIVASFGVGDGAQAPRDEVSATRQLVAKALVNPVVQSIFSVPQAKVTQALSNRDIDQALLVVAPKTSKEIQLLQALSAGNISRATKLIKQTTDKVQTQVVLTKALAQGDIDNAIVAVSAESASTQRLLLASALARGDVAGATQLLR